MRGGGGRREMQTEKGEADGKIQKSEEERQEHGHNE